mgnify:FL=1
MIKIAVFASGHGSNLQALIDATTSGELPATIELVGSDRREAYCLARASEAGLLTLAFSPKDYGDKAQYEELLAEKLAELEVEYLVLAGYMRLIGPTLLERYPRRIVNIHPSLLPLFPGRDGIGQALAAGVTETGVTIHYVDGGMDTGPIIAQERIAVSPEEDRASLEKRIHVVEHSLYPRVLRQIFMESREEQNG